LGWIRAVDKKDGEDYNEIYDIIEHDLVEWLSLWSTEWT